MSDKNHDVTTLGQLAPGRAFVTQSGVFAMKTAVSMIGGHSMCIAFGTGAMVRFEEGDKTPVRPVYVERIKWGLHINCVDSHGHVHCFRCSMGRMGFTDSDFARQENKEAWIYNTLKGWEGDGLGGIYKDANTLPALPARCFSCEKPLVPCYPVIPEKFKERSDY